MEINSYGRVNWIIQIMRKWSYPKQGYVNIGINLKGLDRSEEEE